MKRTLSSTQRLFALTWWSTALFVACMFLHGMLTQ
jgi:hypothetical protein